MSGARVTVAIDAMGGDHAPAEIVAGALQAAEELGLGILLTGREEEITPLLPDGGAPPRVEVVDAREVVAMDEEPAAAARTKKDSSLVRAAQAVREGQAQAMVGAGNTGATMAAALLKMGRIRGIARPAIAVPIPVPGGRPQLLIDGGSTVDCTPEWLVQFARMGREYARTRLGVDEPAVGLLSNGEEPGKGDELRKAAYPLLEKVDGFAGNVEGRDLMHAGVDVIVADGFTGNVALKSLEGALRAAVTLVFGVLDSTPEAKEASKVVAPLLLAAAAGLDPDTTGGAALLGVKGVCVISHGSSSARAIVNATRVAAECVETGVVERMKEAIDAG
ncbi:MAG TPA: phosphate acyltransferase PlsX [Acidimicrobiia bacterium]|nr:phosphate acyltransferase PlsX [Acidimicrobiia bacterium]